MFRWQYQAKAEPVSTLGESITLDKWYSPSPIPARIRTIATALLVTACFFVPVISQAEDVTLDKWMPSASQVYAKPARLIEYPFLSYCRLEGEVPTLDRWVQSIVQPQAQKKPRSQDTGLSFVPIVAQAEDITLDKWFSIQEGQREVPYTHPPYFPVAHELNAGRIFSDSFDRADSSALGGSWVEKSRDWSIGGNALVCGSGSQKLAYWHATIATANYSVSAEVILENGKSIAVVARRVDNGASNSDWYGAYVEEGTNNNLYLVKVTNSNIVNGPKVDIDASAGVPHTLTIACYNDIQILFWDGVEKARGRDSSFSSAGNAGVYMDELTNASSFNNFVVANFREPISFDKWYVPIVQPLFAKPRTAYFNPLAFTLAIITESVTLDKWYMPISQPSRIITSWPQSQEFLAPLVPPIGWVGIPPSSNQWKNSSDAVNQWIAKTRITTPWS